MGKGKIGFVYKLQRQLQKYTQKSILSTFARLVQWFWVAFSQVSESVAKKKNIWRNMCGIWRRNHKRYHLLMSLYYGEKEKLKASWENRCSHDCWAHCNWFWAVLSLLFSMGLQNVEMGLWRIRIFMHLCSWVFDRAVSLTVKWRVNEMIPTGIFSGT